MANEILNIREYIEAVRERFDELGITRSEFAARCDIEPSTVGRILDGETKLIRRTTLIKITDGLALDIDVPRGEQNTRYHHLAHRNPHRITVFLSFPAQPVLRAHRIELEDTIRRLGHELLSFESHWDSSRFLQDTCRQKLRSADLVIALVATRAFRHTDDTLRILKLQTECAKEAGVPFMTFLRVPRREGSRATVEGKPVLGSPLDVGYPAGESDQCSSRLWWYIRRESVCDYFSGPKELARKVAKCIDKVRPRGSLEKARTERPRASVFDLNVYHPLRPATHFRGRREILSVLERWCDDSTSSDRVVSLLGMGGIGKTAIAAEVIKRIDRTSLAGHVFEWSFYEDQSVDSFFQEASAVFHGEENKDRSMAQIPRLERALREGAGHLFVLDGLEAIQSGGTDTRAFGELEDRRMRNFLRAVVTGALGMTRALITTRFPLTDLNQWEQVGLRTQRLEGLDAPSAVSVLRAWGVHGDDEELAGIASRFGCHPLSISVLGSYLAEFWDGNLKKAHHLTTENASATGSEGAKLQRVLNAYIASLHAVERKILTIISQFERWISLRDLEYIAQNSSEPGGRIAGADSVSISRHLARLESLGLVTINREGDGVWFTIHPILRDNLRKLTSSDATRLQESDQHFSIIKERLRAGEKTDDGFVDQVDLQQLGSFMPHSKEVERQSKKSDSAHKSVKIRLKHVDLGSINSDRRNVTDHRYNSDSSINQRLGPLFGKDRTSRLVADRFYPRGWCVGRISSNVEIGLPPMRITYEYIPFQGDEVSETQSEMLFPNAEHDEGD